MLTRVVVVAFVFTVGFAVAGAMAQVTDSAPAATATATTPAAETTAATTQPVPPPISATQPLVTSSPPSTRPTNRSAEETLRQMLQPQGDAARPLKPIEEAPPATDVTSGTGAVAPGGTAQKVLREGTLLLDRMGRLTRSDDGKTFEFTLDSDGRRMADAPMILLPNRRLMQLENQVQASYRDVKIRASGEVMEYRGRNYLLLQRWSVVPDVAQPLQ